MSITVDHLTHQALTLGDAERALLARELLRSLEPDVQAARPAEIARRMERVRQGTAEGRPADEVFRELRARYQP